MPKGDQSEDEEAGEVVALGLVHPPRHYMVQHTKGIQTGTTRHSAVLTITRLSLQRPLDLDMHPWSGSGGGWWSAWKHWG